MIQFSICFRLDFLPKAVINEIQLVCFCFESLSSVGKETKIQKIVRKLSKFVKKSKLVGKQWEED